jgi:hypothetical protein
MSGRVGRWRWPPAWEESATRELEAETGRRKSPFLSSRHCSPDPCRGESRNRAARIRAQREPGSSPAGTGADYRDPRGGFQLAVRGNDRLRAPTRGTQGLGESGITSRRGWCDQWPPTTGSDSSQVGWACAFAEGGRCEFLGHLA